MAKKSKIAKNEKRKVIVARYSAKRLELKKALVDPAGTDESREAARIGLQKLPRNASPVRVRGRDAIDGRPRGFLSQFGVSRVRFRDMAHRGGVAGKLLQADACGLAGLVGAVRVDECLLQFEALRGVAGYDHLALLVASDLALLGHG